MDARISTGSPESTSASTQSSARRAPAFGKNVASTRLLPPLRMRKRNQSANSAKKLPWPLTTQHQDWVTPPRISWTLPSRRICPEFLNANQRPPYAGKALESPWCVQRQPKNMHTHIHTHTSLGTGDAHATDRSSVKTPSLCAGTKRVSLGCLQCI